MDGSTSAAETPLEGVATPLPDLRDLPLLPPPHATPGSSSRGGGAGDAGSLLAYRNSLGAVSEREEGRTGVGAAGGEAEDGDGDGYVRGLAGSEGLEEADLFAEEGEGLGAAEMQALWDPTVFGDGG